MNRYWRDDIEKARSEAKAEHKLLVLEYDAALDGDFVSAMTPEEFEAENAKYQKRGIYGGWITVSEDYTQNPAEVEEKKAEETVTVKSFILSNLLRGAKDRLEKLAQMGAPRDHGHRPEEGRREARSRRAEDLRRHRAAERNPRQL